MKTKRQYEMSSLVSQEVPLEELDSAGSVFNPFHRSDTVAGGNESDTITGEMSPVSVEPLKPAKPAGSVLNSMDFDEVASRQWRKVHTDRMHYTTALHNKYTVLSFIQCA